MLQNEILKNVLYSVEKSAKTDAGRPAVIFDLDSTLFCVSPRTQAIVHELSQRPDVIQMFPQEIKVLREIVLKPTDWGLRTAFERQPKLVSSEFFSFVRKYWNQRFFSNEFMSFDTIYPNANAFVRQIQNAGAKIFYLTGRNAQSMMKGTIANLIQHQFPFVDEDMLYMKPSDHASDEDFKTLWFRENHERFSDIWYFENEPVIIEQVRSTLPRVKIIFVDSTHSGKAIKPNDLPSIRMSYE